MEKVAVSLTRILVILHLLLVLEVLAMLLQKENAKEVHHADFLMMKKEMMAAMIAKVTIGLTTVLDLKHPVFAMQIKEENVNEAAPAVTATQMEMHLLKVPLVQHVPQLVLEVLEFVMHSNGESVNVVNHVDSLIPPSHRVISLVTLLLAATIAVPMYAIHSKRVNVIVVQVVDSLIQQKELEHLLHSIILRSVEVAMLFKEGNANVVTHADFLTKTLRKDINLTTSVFNYLL